ncbi:methylmalonyl Co-A mutase-associated GTPase MeaB [Aureivirga sp. CE67]|uniref:methylmalonyl Co-A mutase-associated GTPase MeaB n=1 Tax=Aureivirga sp. CE67 TaxID=1788983 RepID=UPI0018CA3735|nr:methylmalonyl Co-A mutase-associated GTPase MeaB [Aureivirga sp. CE67]
MQKNKDEKSKKTLTEIEGVAQPDKINQKSINFIKRKRIKQPSVEEFIQEIISGNISFLSRAITLIESSNPKHQEKANKILEGCLPHANNSYRIGITGVPGVGKSTFIESFGNELTKKGHKVAVLAIDPSSSINKGSILGDKTRMETLVNNPKAFIRPSPSGESLGGVAQKTRETIILCEAAGYSHIIVETVGVGQSETMVHSMVDFFLLLKVAGTGDELQGIKRGIIEMADAIAINKADGDNIKRAKQAKLDFSKALHLYPLKENGWTPKVLTCSGLNNLGVLEIISMIESFFETTKANNYFTKRRESQNHFWFQQTIEDALKRQFFENNNVKNKISDLESSINQHKLTPFEAAKQLLELYFMK